MERILTCIVCPRGCTLKVELSDEGKVLSVTGNACKRGVIYAEAECTHPMRTVTSTVRCEDGVVVACKTSGTVPKEKVFDVMKAINGVSANNDLQIGDVIIENVLGLGVDVVATSNR
jgi:CxxC motif-containing protein